MIGNIDTRHPLCYAANRRAIQGAGYMAFNAADVGSAMSACPTPLIHYDRVYMSHLTLDGVDVKKRMDELEAELEESKGHIQRLYDEVEKIILYTPSSGSEYIEAKRKFEAVAGTVRTSILGSNGNRTTRNLTLTSLMGPLLFVVIVCIMMFLMLK